MIILMKLLWLLLKKVMYYALLLIIKKNYTNYFLDKVIPFSAFYINFSLLHNMALDADFIDALSHHYQLRVQSHTDREISV